MKPEGVGRLYTKFSAAMMAAALRKTNDFHMAQDAVQSVFERVIANPEKIDDSIDKKVCSLLCVMTEHAVIDMYYKKQRTIGAAVLDDEDGPESVSLDDDALTKMMRKEFMQDVKNAIGRLPDTYRIPLLLRYAHNLTNEQIAKALNIEIGNVYIRVHRGRNELKRILKEEGKL